ncbi:hypothetical protein ENSA5_20940 [Enhygromyxa salina]|uniref:Uncharacterized protein n=1 Tax=Enhygromyxa salina TaxID=215803 RepID=A0A2S9YCG9_9BACT|nr:hypothetical protein [Enhygromyxa salina]PRQ02742.1 hypothetical protein ENSA5_20940 [Enhygromyxa salina]
MRASEVETLLRESERQALILVLRAHPEWTLAELSRCVHSQSPCAEALARLTVGDLLVGVGSERGDLQLPDDGGPLINRALLERAKRADGEVFDALVESVILDSPHTAVSAKYLRARLGGPRWKLQAALARLVAAGVVERGGKTSATRYWPRGPTQPKSR